MVLLFSICFQAQSGDAAYPRCVISADERNRLGLSIGAYGYSGKPVERDAILATFDEVKSFGSRSKRLLAIEPALPNGSLVNLFGEDDVEVQSAATLEEAEQAILDNGFDCVVLDLSTPADESLRDLVATLVVAPEPLVVFLPRDPNEEERKHIASSAGVRSRCGSQPARHSCKTKSP
jgi:hypothetical protein